MTIFVVRSDPVNKKKPLNETVVFVDFAPQLTINNAKMSFTLLLVRTMNMNGAGCGRGLAACHTRAQTF